MTRDDHASAEVAVDFGWKLPTCSNDTCQLASEKGVGKGPLGCVGRSPLSDLPYGNVRLKWQAASWQSPPTDAKLDEIGATKKGVAPPPAGEEPIIHTNRVEQPCPGLGPSC